MNVAGVESAFRTRTGLDPAALGPSVFPRAVETRMRERTVATPEAYFGLFTADPDEPDALAAEVVVPETWFFRGGRDLFDRLAQFVAAHAATRNLQPVRILSFPCSTGEEPYSLAIALHEHLVPPAQYNLDAVDLSPRHLASAAEGRYPAFAFREPGTDIRPTHFREQADRWEVAPHLRAVVQFRRGNATHPVFLADEPPYDLILCRNLFIYLTPDARRQAMSTLDRLLAPKGWLCLTHAEANRLPPGRFVQEGPPAFGLYRRGSASGVHRRPEAVRAVPAPKTPAVAEQPAGPPAPAPAPTPPLAVPVGSRVTAAAVRALADAGRLTEARAACARLLEEQPSTAEVYSLLGIIHQAEGQMDRAVEAFRKALYLEPDYPEALSHMIVLCDRRGDAAQARALRKRLERANGEDAA
jgi:chemotaxis protein methyltransferase WspC